LDATRILIGIDGSFKVFFSPSSGFRDASRSYCMLSTCSSDTAKLWHGLWWVLLLCFFICLQLILFSLYKISAKIWDSKKWTFEGHFVFLFFINVWLWCSKHW